MQEQILDKQESERENVSKTHRKVLLIDYNKLSQNDVEYTKAWIKKRLKLLFAKYIGISHSITPYEMFKEIYGKYPYDLNVYERSYWWNVIIVILRELRRNCELFVVHRGSKYFVLQSEKELEMYNEMIDRNVRNLESIKKIAKKWIDEEKWKNL